MQTTKSRSKQSAHDGQVGGGQARQKEPHGPSPEAIRERAYEIFCQREARHANGDPVSDWCEAEQELHQELRGRELLEGDLE